MKLVVHRSIKKSGQNTARLFHGGYYHTCIRNGRWWPLREASCRSYLYLYATCYLSGHLSVFISLSAFGSLDKIFNEVLCTLLKPKELSQLCTCILSAAVACIVRMISASGTILNRCFSEKYLVNGNICCRVST